MFTDVILRTRSMWKKCVVKLEQCGSNCNLIRTRNVVQYWISQCLGIEKNTVQAFIVLNYFKPATEMFERCERYKAVASIAVFPNLAGCCEPL